MTREEIQQDVLKIISNHLNISETEINDETQLTQIGADSLDKIEIVMLIEEKFDVNIDDTEVENVKTFEELVDLVTKKIGEGDK